MAAYQSAATHPSGTSRHTSAGTFHRVLVKVEHFYAARSPLATVVNFSCELDPENHPKAEATVSSGALDNTQQGQAKVAAGVHTDPDATDDDKNDATQKIVAVKQMPAQAEAVSPVEG